MSTKTSFKRIALVAAAALALGGFSAVSSNAAVVSGSTAITCPISLENNNAGAVSCTGQVGGAVRLVWTATGQETAIAATTVFKFTTTGMTITAAADSSAGTVAAVAATSTDYSLGVKITPTRVDDTVTLDFTAAAAGAATLVVQAISGTTGGLTTADGATVNWVATSTITPSAQYSTSFIAAGNVDTATSDAVGVKKDKAAGAYTNARLAAIIKVTVADTNGNVMNAPTVSANVAGVGVVGLNTVSANLNASTVGRGVSLAATSGGIIYVGVWADGNAGTSTITITSGGVTLGVETVTFTGNAATATATQNLYVAQAGTQLGATPNADGGVTNDGTTVAKTAAFTVAVKDSAGGAVQTSPAYKLVSSNPAVISVGTCTEYTASKGNWECFVSGATGALSGQSATVTFTTQNGTTDTTGVYSIKSAPLTFTIGGSIASTVLSTDAASYGAGAPVSIIATVKDSSGNAAFDQDAALFDEDLVSSAALGTATALPAGATNAAVINGKKTFKGYYAPIYGGDFTITGSTGVYTTTTTVAALSATATADAGQAGSNASLALDAANAATDAANNAYDEAQNATQAASDALAAVTALAAQVKSLIASVKKLTAAVAKLKK